MAKWILVALALLGGSAQAHQLAPATDGCAVLNDIVYQEVTASRWGMTGADLAHTGMLEPNVMVCTNTAQTVSKAFAQAMHVVGGELTWREPINWPVDTCLSGFLDQCQPRGGAGSLPLWKAISSTVLRAMPEGTASDRSIFSGASMRLAVRASLRPRHVETREALY